MRAFKCALGLQVAFLLAVAQETFAAAPTSENFDGIDLTADSDGDNQRSLGGSPRAINNWTISLVDSGGNNAPDTGGTPSYLDVTGSTVDTSLAGPGDNALIVNGHFGVVAEARFSATTGEEFWLQSFPIQGGLMNSAARVLGYRDGAPVASQDITVTGSILSVALDHASDQDWQNIDQFRIVQQDGSADILFNIDDITVATAVLPNTAPTVANLNGDSLGFTEGGSATLLDLSSNATVADSESADFDGGNVTVSITTNRVSGEDVLSIQNQGTGVGQIGVSGANVSYGGVLIGTFTGGSGTSDLVITLNANGTPAAVQALVRNLTYSNSNAGDPNTSTRTVSITVNDGDGGTSTAANVSVSVTGVNDAPTATNLTQTVTYTEDPGGNVALGDIVITDADGSSDTVTGTLTLSNPAAGVLTTGTFGSVTSTYNAGTGVWTVTGSVTDTNAAFAAVAFTPATNWDQDITVATRVRDAANTGPADGTITLDVTAVNDAPTATNLTQTVSYTEDPGGSVALGDIVITDIDGGETVTGTLTLSNSAAGALTTGTFGSATSTYNAGTGVWTVTGSVTDTNAALAAVAFTPAANWDQDITVATRVRDAANTGPADGTITLDVTTVNDAPTDIALTSSSINESSTAAGASVGTLSTIDVEGGDTHTYSLVSNGTSGNGTCSADGNNALFQIDNVNDELETASSLDPGSYSVCIETSDGTDSYQKTFTVTVADDVAPSGHSVSFDDGTINGTEVTGISFNFTGAEVGTDYSYTISSSGGGTPVTGTGTIASAGDQISGIDVSGLSDGTLTLSVTLTDAAGNSAGAVTDTATLDSAAPTGHSVSFDDGTINGAEASSISFTFASAEVGTDYSYIISSSGGGTPVTGTGALASVGGQISGIDVSGLSDGTLTLSVTLTDAAGNSAGAVTDTATLDASAPNSHSVSFDDSAINSTEASSISFTFASAEVGADYSYTISSSGGGTPVTGTGTIASATDQISGIDVSGLTEGTLTLSVTLTDSTGNSAGAVTDTTTLDNTLPALNSTNPADGATNVAFDADLVLTFSENVIARAGADAAIELYDSGNNLVTTAIVTSSDVSVSGNVVTVDFFPDLWPTMAYYVHISGTAFQDAAGNLYAGIADNTTLNFTVSNNAPAATDDSDTTNEDTAIDIDVLANDTDSDSNLNAASTAIAAAPANGSTSIDTATGIITYTPNANFNGSDSFTYTVEDVQGGLSNTATVSVTVNAVNDAPVAVSDMDNAQEDTLVSIDVAANDTDVDTGDSVDNTTITIVTTPTNGTATVNGGQIDYDPNADYNGTDSFTYTIEDQNGAVSNTANVVINVTGVNDLPTAANDSATVNEDDFVDIDVMDNDSDIDGTLDSTTMMVMANPANGSTSVDALTGVITYTPNAEYNGSDSFTYVVQDDAAGTSNAAMVNITITSINDAPVAANDTAIVLEDASYEVNVLGNDSDVDGTMVPASVEVVTAPVDGTTSVNAGTGAITYTPAGDFSGTDSFTYRVQDNDGAWSAPATVTMTVDNVNDPPTAVDDTATTEDEIPLVIDILANDSDIDDGLDTNSVAIASAPTNGSVIDNGDGSVTYTPDAGFVGSDSFTYTVDDNTPATSNTATVVITVIQGNEVPVIGGSAPTSITVGEAYSFTPTASDADTDDTLTFSITGQPAWLDFNTAIGELSGTPADADEGTTGNIVISVSDGEETVSLAAFTIEVAAGADSDGDTISDYQEGLDETDPADPLDYLDLIPPMLSAPADVTLDAFALYTPVHIKQLLGLPLSASNAEADEALGELAIDNVDGAGCCDPSVDDALLGTLLLLPSGANEVTWLAEDRMGNMAEVTQIVNLRPLVSLGKDQSTVEGNTVTISVILNGESPFYPFTVPYVIDEAGTATSSDHDLVNGTVTFTEGQTSATVEVTLVEDGISDNNETLVVRLDDRTSHAEDLADGYDPQNPDIYDINSSARTRHTIRIVEGNLPPDATLQLRQGGRDTVLVTPGGGEVTATVSVYDPSSGDTHTFDWSASDNRLIDTDGNATDETLVFDPTGLNPGKHKVQITVTDSEGATDTVRLFFRVVSTLPTLSADEDTDEDGTDDQTEGTGDSDDDGIPEYLDNNPAVNVVPEEANQTKSYLMECDPGVRCRLGQFSIVSEFGGTLLADGELEEQEGLMPDPDYTPVGGVFDFEIKDLSAQGQSVSIVIPLRAAVPENAVYRKFQDGAWLTFVENANNTLHSTEGNAGYCPPPGDEAWEPGLVAGHLCVQLTIEDGGPNDADGLVNSAVEDPGAVSMPTDHSVSVNVDSKSGGGAFDKWLLGLIGALWLFGRLAVKRSSRSGKKEKHFGSKAASVVALLFCGSLMFSSAPTKAQDGFEDKLTLELGVYNTESTQSRGGFVSDMAAEGVTVDLQQYEINRNAWQIAFDYKINDWAYVRVGYLDLGDARVTFNANAADNATIERALEKHHPFSANGLTLAYRYRYIWREHTEFVIDAGLFNWEQDINVRTVSLSPDGESGTDPLLGLGIGYHVNPRATVSLRYQRLMLDPGDMDLLGGTVSWRF